jgi:hypothetical protein
MRDVREGWIGPALLATLAVAGAGPLSAQQSPAAPPEPSIVAPATPVPTAPVPAAKPPKRSHIHAAAPATSAAPAAQRDPDLDTDDQLAPSQMKQPMPGAVAAPAGGVPARKLPRPMNADTAAPSSAPVAPVARPSTARVSPLAAGAKVVTCAGIFAKDSSHLKLAMAYETKNVTFTEVDATGGTKVPASVVFANDPKRRLEVWWSNPAARSETYLIVINGQSTWTAPGGMRLGLNIAQLEKLNHKPFKIKGFDKNGVASVSDWDGGVLAALPGNCKSGLSLRADPKAAADAVSALTADHEFNSSDPVIRAVKPSVSEILIGY